MPGASGKKYAEGIRCRAETPMKAPCCDGMTVESTSFGRPITGLDPTHAECFCWVAGGPHRHGHSQAFHHECTHEHMPRGMPRTHRGADTLRGYWRDHVERSSVGSAQAIIVAEADRVLLRRWTPHAPENNGRVFPYGRVSRPATRTPGKGSLIHKALRGGCPRVSGLEEGTGSHIRPSLGAQHSLELTAPEGHS